MSDLQALENLGDVIAEADGLTGPTPEQVQQAQAEAEAQTQAQAWAQLPMMLGGMLAMLAPEVQAIYTDERCAQWGERMVPVAEKYGWNGPSNLPEIGLAISTMGLAVPTIIIVRGKLAQLKAQREAVEASRNQAAQAQVIPSPITTQGVADGIAS